MLRRAILIVTALIATAVAVDLTAYSVLDWRRAGSGPDRFFRPDPFLGHAHRPNAAGPWYLEDASSWVETNAYGMADSDRALEKSRRRIALLGDSTMEFWEAPPELRPQVLLEKRLGGALEVLNFGVRGYGSDQTLLQLRDLVLSFRPDIVVYLFCINDLFDNARTFNLQRTLGKPRFLLSDREPDGIELTNSPVKAPRRSTTLSERLEEYSFLYRTLRQALGAPSPWQETLADEAQLLGDEDVLHPEIRPYLLQYSGVDQERLELTFRLIAAMKRIAETAGARFLLVEGLHLYALDQGLQRTLVRRYGDVFDFHRVSDELARFAEGRSMAFLSLPTEARAHGLNVRAIMHDDIHSNGRGARFFSRAVYRRLVALGWVPARE